MNVFDDSGGDRRQRLALRGRKVLGAAAGLTGLLVVLVVAGIAYYMMCCFEVPSRHMAVMTRKTGQDLENTQEIAPSSEYKGVQAEVLGEGRYFRNPWHWKWQVVPQIEIPPNKMGVRIRLFGDDLPYGQIVAEGDDQKGILSGVLRPGRYTYNARVLNPESGTIDERTIENYAELIELHDPIVIPAGFKGVVTNLAGPISEDPNQLLVPKGFRGVQEETLDEGTYYRNPYEYRINLIDTRSQRLDLSSGGELGFPSKDGFWITLDGTIEFRVIPESAAEVFVTFNDTTNDSGRDARVDEEIIRKVILPNARSFCRLKGSEYSGREFISGEKRNEFQEEFGASMIATCRERNIQVVQVAITSIRPPQKIAAPVRERQIAVQNERRFAREILQQESEKELAIQKELITQRQEIVDTDREVIQVTTEAKRRQEVALIEAQQRLRVADLELQAAQDLAAAELARGQAESDVIRFQNEAVAAGWQKAVSAFNGNGTAYAKWVMFTKLAPAFRQMMVNTADSPIMDVFQQYSGGLTGGNAVPAGPANEGTTTARRADEAATAPPLSTTRADSPEPTSATGQLE